MKTNKQNLLEKQFESYSAIGRLGEFMQIREPVQEPMDSP